MSIRKVSKKLAGDLRIYNILRKDYLLDHPTCEASISRGCTYRSTEIHHKRGRGKNLNNVDTFLACCRPCHDWIGAHPHAARQLGFTESRITKPIK